MNDKQTDLVSWKDVPFIDFMNACDDYASGRYAIDSSDLGIDEKMMADAQEALESPKELIEFYAKKYDLKPYERSKIDIHTMLKARRQAGAIWSIEDVQSHHPDLNEVQALQVLQQWKNWHDSNNGFVFKRLDGVTPSQGYTKEQAVALHGKAYASVETDGTRLGRIVDSYTYRYEGDAHVCFALRTEYKSANEKTLRQGVLDRFDLEETSSTLLLTGKLADRVKEQLCIPEKPQKELLEAATRAVTRSQQLRASAGQGIGF